MFPISSIGSAADILVAGIPNGPCGNSSIALFLRSGKKRHIHPGSDGGTSGSALFIPADPQARNGTWRQAVRAASAVSTPHVVRAAFLPKAERILRELSDAKAEIVELSGKEDGELLLGAIPTIAPYLLPAVLSRLWPPSRHRCKSDGGHHQVLVDQLHKGSLH